MCRGAFCPRGGAKNKFLFVKITPFRPNLILFCSTFPKVDFDQLHTLHPPTIDFAPLFSKVGFAPLFPKVGFAPLFNRFCSTFSKSGKVDSNIIHVNFLAVNMNRHRSTFHFTLNNIRIFIRLFICEYKCFTFFTFFQIHIFIVIACEC